MKKYTTLFVVLVFAYSSTFGQFVPVGNAVTNCFELTQNAGMQIGGIWSTNTIDLNDPFIVSFDMDIGNIAANDADGLSFVLQQDGLDALGGIGGNLGYVDSNGVDPPLSDNSLGVAFRSFIWDAIEIWNNSVADISGNPYALPPVSGVHPVTIQWDPATTKLTVDFENNGVDLTWTNDIINNYFTGDPIVYWGFTSSNFLAGPVQKVCNVKFNNTPLEQAALVGTALSNFDCIELNQNAGMQIGGVWSTSTIDLNIPFIVTYDMDIGDIATNDADGMAFVLQQDGLDVLGGIGGNLGYVNSNGVDPPISNNSLAVAFRTFTWDAIEIWNGSIADISGSPYALPPVSGVHPVTIQWDPSTTTLTVDFNDDGVDITWTNDIVNNYFGGNPIVNWGFTSSNFIVGPVQQVCGVQLSNTLIPTMGEWSLVIFMLIVLNVGAVTIANSRRSLILTASK